MVMPKFGLDRPILYVSFFRSDRSLKKSTRYYLYL